MMSEAQFHRCRLCDLPAFGLACEETHRKTTNAMAEHAIRNGIFIPSVCPRSDSQVASHGHFGF
eukprot:1140730-Rhodomonas_salina.1